MKNRKNYTGLYLTGGLGNQLFQFAAALATNHGTEICIFDNLGRPKFNKHGNPELLSFNIDELFDIKRNKNKNYFVGKTAGFILRTSIWPRKYEKNYIIQSLLKGAATFVNLIFLREFLAPVTISKVGYEEIKLNQKVYRIFNPLLIGYFQSSRWVENVKDQLIKISLTEEGENLAALKLEAQLASPIIVHIRRGDYRNESTFGMPGRNYYQRAIEKISYEFPDKPIWVFSDEILEAKKILDFLPQSRILYIPDVDQESAASLMAMRLGCAYVIANSTFSWWGAYLSISENPLVIAPDPWFVGQEDPALLIPSNWIRLRY